MLSKRFDTLCGIIAFISPIAFFAYPVFTGKFFLDSSVYAPICIVMIAVSFAVSMLLPYCENEGIDKDKGLDDEVTLFLKGARSAQDINRIVVTILSAKSKQEIKNILEKIKKITRKKEGVFAKLIVPLLFAIASVTFYMLQGSESPQGILITTIVFISSFAIFHSFIQACFDIRLGAKSNAIANIAMKNQHIPNSKGSTETIKPFIFNCNYRDIEGYPMKQRMFTRPFYLFLDKLRTSEKKSEVDEILKEFVVTENSRMSRPEKAKAKFALMEKLDNLDKEANNSWLYREHI